MYTPKNQDAIQKFLVKLEREEEVRICFNVVKGEMEMC